MIKIIKPGNPERKVKRVYELECPLCGCVFEFEQKDFESTLFFKESYINCPCCQQTLGFVLEELKRKIVDVEETENE